MERKLEQRYAVKFCVKLRKSPTETFDMIRTAYGNDAMCRSRLFKLHENG